jgi:hypothetical protein
MPEQAHGSGGDGMGRVELCVVAVVTMVAMAAVVVAAAVADSVGEGEVKIDDEDEGESDEDKDKDKGEGVGRLGGVRLRASQVTRRSHRPVAHCNTASRVAVWPRVWETGTAPVPVGPAQQKPRVNPYP